MGDAGGETRSMSETGAPPLDARTAARVRVAAAVARGKAPELEMRFAAARDARVPGLWIEELLLQSMLVVGYPLALVAFGTGRGLGAPIVGDGAGAGAGAGPGGLAHAGWGAGAGRGGGACREGGGRPHPQPRGDLRGPAPAPAHLGRGGSH